VAGQSLDGIIADCRDLVDGAELSAVKRLRKAGEKLSVIKERSILAKFIFFCK
jgi:hypothetical protein